MMMMVDKGRQERGKCSLHTKPIQHQLFFRLLLLVPLEERIVKTLVQALGSQYHWWKPANVQFVLVNNNNQTTCVTIWLSNKRTLFCTRANSCFPLCTSSTRCMISCSISIWWMIPYFGYFHLSTYKMMLVNHKMVITLVFSHDVHVCH